MCNKCLCIHVYEEDALDDGSGVNKRSLILVHFGFIQYSMSVTKTPLSRLGDV